MASTVTLPDEVMSQVIDYLITIDRPHLPATLDGNESTLYQNHLTNMIQYKLVSKAWNNHIQAQLGKQSLQPENLTSLITVMLLNQRIAAEMAKSRPSAHNREQFSKANIICCPARGWESHAGGLHSSLTYGLFRLAESGRIDTSNVKEIILDHNIGWASASISTGILNWQARTEISNARYDQLWLRPCIDFANNSYPLTFHLRTDCKLTQHPDVSLPCPANFTLSSKYFSSPQFGTHETHHPYDHKFNIDVSNYNTLDMYKLPATLEAFWKEQINDLDQHQDGSKGKVQITLITQPQSSLAHGVFNAIIQKLTSLTTKQQDLTVHELCLSFHFGDPEDRHPYTLKPDNTSYWRAPTLNQLGDLVEGVLG